MKQYTNVENRLKISETVEVKNVEFFTIEQLQDKLQKERDRKDFDNSVRDAQIAELESLITTAQNLGVTESQIIEE